MALQDKFDKANFYYIVSTENSIGNSTNVTMPANCILEFRGGTINLGTLTLNNTLVLPLGLNPKAFITSTIAGTYREGLIIYDDSLKKMKLWNGTAWTNLDGTALS